MVKVRTKDELSKMRASGRISAKALKKALGMIKSKVSIGEIEKTVMNEISSFGAKASFKSVPGYDFATCITINDEVVHGLPNRDITLKKGDKVSIDLGALYRGWHTDCAWSVLVDDKQSVFLRVGEEALWKGIAQAIDGNRIGDISAAIQETIEGAGYKVVHSLVGHGVGEELHQDPEVPGFGERGTGMVLKEGMTLAIETIYTERTHEVVQDDDGWTIRSEDGSLGGLFEMSIIVGKKKAEILTDWRRV